jgi:ribosomal protein L11 methylase PrmA
MTIENATPSSAETVAALFDNLVNAVAARVIEQLSDNITVRIEHAMDTWAMTSGIFDDRVNDLVQSFVDNSMDVDDVVRKALDNLDLDDMVVSAVQDLSFEVTVSR